MDDLQTNVGLVASKEVTLKQVEFAVKTKYGKYFGFKKGHEPSVWGDANRIGSYEKLHFQDSGTQIGEEGVIQNIDGDYLGFKLGIGVWVAERVGSYEKITIRENGNGTLTLYNKDGHWLEFTNEGGVDVDSD